MVWIIIISSIVLYLLYVWVIDKVHDYFAHMKRDMSEEVRVEEMKEFRRKHPSTKQYEGEEHFWNPTYHLAHNGVLLMNIPFNPDKNEIIYLENNYDEQCN